MAAVLPVHSLTIVDETKNAQTRIAAQAHPGMKDNLLLYQMDVRLIIDQSPAAF
jgi:hypothetical protein